MLDRGHDLAALRLAAIVEFSDDAIISKDLDGTIRSWNRAAERMFGYAAADVVGKSIRIIVPADRQGEEDDVLRRIGRGESVDHFETVRQRRDGTLISISLTVSPIRGADGQIIGASKIARDISDRKRTEAALAEAQKGQAELGARLRALVSASGSLLASPRVHEVRSAMLALAEVLMPADAHAIWRFSRPSNVWQIDASHGLSEVFSREISPQADPSLSTQPFGEPLVAEDVQALPWLDARREAYATEGIASLLAVPLLIGGEPSCAFVCYYRERHHFSEVEVQTSAAFGNMASAALTTAQLYDEQTRRHEQSTFLARASAALGASLDYQDTLTRVANLAVPYIADWCAVDLVNDAGQIERLAITHIDPAKRALAQEMKDRYADDPEPQGVRSVIRTGRCAMVSHISDEMLVAAAGGDEDRIRLVRTLGLTSYICVPLLARGRTLGALTFASADSGRQYGRADLRFAQDVAGRAALAMDNARAYEEARKANQLKDEFLGTLSHELRTPLNAIVGYARMLEAGVIATDKRQTALKVLSRNATALTQIVEDVLDVSRIVSGKVRLDVQPVDLSGVLADALATTRLAADAKGIAVQVTIDAHAGLVAGDADRLQQVVWNLLSNAVKFTPKGGRIQVRLERVQSYVEIIVSDTGIGIPAAFIPRLFERFTQGDSGFARDQGGLGLGLAISRHLVEMHGGTISGHSAGVGAGATFRVALPVMLGARPENIERRGVAPAPEGVEGPAPLEGLRVVAVDDEEDGLALLREVLEFAGAAVTTVRSPDTALAIVEQARPHVLITDIGMPGMNGFELLAQVRRSEVAEVSRVPAAALTAYARSEDRLTSLRAGFQMHLAKPIDPAELIAAVRTLAMAARPHGPWPESRESR